MAQTRTEAKPAPQALNDIEGILKVSLRPIRPNQEFVNKLGRRLINPPNTTLEPRTSALSLLVVGLGLLCGVLVLILGKKSIVLLLVALLALLLPRLKVEETQEQVILLPPLR
jgi:hypothetical protein